MATIGLRDLFRAPINVGADGVETYGTPVRMAKAITAELAVEVAEKPLYADDALDDFVKEFVSGELKLNVNDLPPEECAAVLGQTLDADGVLIAGENDNPPFMAIGFRAKKANGTYKYIWFYKVKFGIPGEKYQTKAEGVEFSTPEIVGVLVKRPDGIWKAEHVALPSDPIAKDWFAKVREPKGATPKPKE